MTLSELTELLAPLTEAATRGRHLRLLVRPGWAAADRPEGEVAGLDVPWTAEAHAQAVQAVHQPVRLASGAVVSAVGDTLVLKMPPDTVWRAEDLSREGWLSPMAARLLTAALGLGRNILVTGPWALASQLMATLVNEGARPALLGENEALPRRWLHAHDMAQVQAAGADRVALLSHAPGQVAQAMGQLSGVVAWLDARRLDRALMRYELGAEAVGGRGNTPLHVLAGLDLIVVVSQQGGPRVVQIAEILLMEQGYRPGLLFLTGLPPAPTALVPVAVPSFLDELAAAGHAVLVEELRQVVPRVPQAPAAAPVAPVPAAAAPSPRPTAGAPPVQRARYPEERQAPRAPRMVIEPPAHDHAEPGWELDRLGEVAPSAAASTAPAGPSGTADDAAMAATYGLGPPPPPGPRSGFAQVLRQQQGQADEPEDELDKNDT